jgi:hypothetical protein
VQAIGAGLTALIRRLEAVGDENCRARLIAMIKRARRAYPHHTDWDRDLTELADKADWPKWALSALPPLSPASDSVGDYYAWRIIADCVRHRDGVHLAWDAPLCNGYIVRLRVTEEAADADACLHEIADTINDTLQDRHDLKYSSCLCFLNLIMMEFEDAPDTPSKDIQVARRALLVRSGVLAGAGVT